MKWKTLQSKYIHRDLYMTMRHDKCQLPDGRIVDPYYVLEFPDWVNIVAVTGEKQIVLVKQYRHGLSRNLIGLPSGFIDENEPPLKAAQRELAEETGYVSDNWKELCQLSPNPANHNNIVHTYLALDCHKRLTQNLDEGEQIEIIINSIDELKEMVQKKELVNALYVSALFYAFNELDFTRF